MSLRVAERAARLCLFILGVEESAVRLEMPDNSSASLPLDDVVREVADIPKPVQVSHDVRPTGSAVVLSRASEEAIAQQAAFLAALTRDEGLITRLTADYPGATLVVMRGAREHNTDAEAFAAFLADYVLVQNDNWSIREWPPIGSTRIVLHVGLQRSR